MEQRTFEELAKMPQLKNGQTVSVRVYGDVYFKGEVVGLSINGIIPNYIVKCTDGMFPSQLYDYEYLSIPLSEIFVIDTLPKTPIVNDANKQKDDLTQWFLVRKNNCGTIGPNGLDTDIIGITTDKKLCKDLQSVFCDFEKVNVLKK